MGAVKDACIGCDNNFQNNQQSCSGEDGCWYFADAKVVKAILLFKNQSPPFKCDFQSYLSCYCKTGYALVREEELTADGYWKLDIDGYVRDDVHF